MLFRQATHFDFPEIIEILEEIQLDMDEIEPEQFVVCELQGAVVGIGRARLYDGFAELCSIGVTLEQRGKGIGRGIVNALMENNIESKLYVVTDIPKFFEKFDFKVSQDYPEEIQLKRERCLTELNCKLAQVLSR